MMTFCDKQNGGSVGTRKEHYWAGNPEMQINDITHAVKGMCLYGCIKIHAFISEGKVLSCAHPRNTGTTHKTKNTMF